MREFLIDVFSEADIQVIGDTPKGSSRGEEILDWLREHPETHRYVALEDNENHIASFIKHEIPYVKTYMKDSSFLLLHDKRAAEAAELLESQKDCPVDEIKQQSCALSNIISVKIQEADDFKIEEILSIVTQLNEPMTNCLVQLDQKAWQSITDTFLQFSINESYQKGQSLLSQIKQDTVIKGK